MPKVIDYPPEVRDLMNEFKRLPGVGGRSAERIAVHLLRNPKARPSDLAEAVARCHEEVSVCPECGFFVGTEECAVCTDSDRDQQALCVVEEATEVLPIERAGIFKGSYHCLGGRLSPLDGVGPDDLRISSLFRRIQDSGVKEVILALSSDVEGEATANYLAEELQGANCQVTRLAQGVPAGGGLEFVNELTLTRAFEGRR